MRVARVILVVVVVLGALFVAGDRIALSVAEHKAAQRAQLTQGLERRPKVSIEGFPFLTQAASGKLEDVKVSARDIAAGTGAQRVRIASFNADLRGVRLSDNYRRAVADSADGLVFITYAELSKAAPDGLTVSYAGRADSGGRPVVKVSGPLMGSRFDVLSQVTVRGADSIGLHAESVPTAFAALGLEDQVREHIDFTLQITHLPATIALTSVTPTPDGISLAAGGKDVVLAN